MAEVKKTVLVGYSAAQMYNLVDAVEEYPKFLPWCGGVTLLSRDAETTVATLHIDYHGLKQQFTTSNRKTEAVHMEIRLLNGPFRHLEGAWRFIALGEHACKIEFELSYEFSSGFLEKVIAPVFNHIANTFVDGFVKRAEQVYESKL